MEQQVQNEHDLNAKLRQPPVVEGLRRYISWQRAVRRSQDGVQFPQYGPVSINLDLTTSCNFSCPHCLDSRLLNSGDYLDLETVKRSIDTLQKNGLRSVIINGGGEPTLHKNFEEIVSFISERGVQIGIATNGSRLEKVAKVADMLQEGDWLRISIDAGKESSFFKSHRPRGRVTLEGILDNAQQIKRINPKLTLGCSYMIVWEGISVNGHELTHNIFEMDQAVSLAREHSFDYVSFKPCLLRLEVSQKESFFDIPDPELESRIIEDIKNNLAKAREAGGTDVRIYEGVNLDAMLDQKVHELKIQPDICHSQFFRTVLASDGIFHCPAFRGVEQAKIGDAAGYRGKANLDFTHARLEHSVRSFNAKLECSMVVCLYHHVNWWIENFITSDKDVSEIREVETDSFFLDSF
jgi:sulfatase maturation enzyme AslB (radical SAM superfamily)